MNTLKLYIFNTFSRILPPSRCNSFKVKLLRWAGAKVGNNVTIFSPKILGEFDLHIGDDVFIGHDPLIFGAAGSTIKIEDYAKIGSRVIIVTGSHEFTPEGPCIEGKGVFKNVTLKSGCAVSSGSIVLPGKTIGEMAHVAAGSIVTHDVPAYTRVAGVPARVIKNFKEDSTKS